MDPTKAKGPFLNITKQKIKGEVNTFTKVPNHPKYPNLTGLDAVRNFSWDSFIGEAEAYMPILIGALRAAMPTAGGEKNKKNTVHELQFLQGISI